MKDRISYDWLLKLPFLRRYAKLNYEDLVTKPLPTLVNLYNHLQLPVDYNALKLAIDYIKKPIPEFTIGDKKGKGMNLYKGPGHNTEKWKKILNIEALKLVEEECKLAMKTFGYNKTF